MIKQLTRRVLARFPLGLAYLSRLYRLRTDYWRPLPTSLDRCISRALLSLGQRPTLVQIGSNDGITGDPFFSHLRNRRLRAVLVEPVPDLYVRLCELHAADSDVQCVNAAVTPMNGTLPFYVVNNEDEQFPAYFSQLGSFDKAVLLKQSLTYPLVESCIREISVRCITFAQLQQVCGVETADVIHIDAEGYDKAIIDTINLDEVRNRMLVFEHCHLSESDYRSVLQKLTSLNYAIRDGGTDTIAWRTISKDKCE